MTDLAHYVTVLASICTDLSLGAIAYRLAKRMESVQVVQTSLLDRLVTRVERLESRVYNGYNSSVVSHDLA